uniref:NADH-ubiquinone oxidoreductase chain 2 n=1 Tax=Blattisocius keegani TaxID=2337216 RepID=A0A4Y5QD92_9ACAR|nr:NADH dehydrogenase subunit 2 [Blattisocius keegani]
MKLSLIKLFSLLLNINSLILSTMSSSMFMIWMTLEMNLMSFIPLMKILNISTSNSMMKYFIIQALSSSMLLLSIILNSKDNFNILMLSFISLWLKLGMFPFQSWFFNISLYLTWNLWLMLNTSQKIISLWSMNFFLVPQNQMMTFIIMNALYSTIEIFNQNSIRWMINASSLNHMSWLLTLPSFSSNMWMIYMTIYIILMMMLNSFLKLNNMLSMYSSLNFKNFKNNLMLMILMINFMGMPPMIGFLMKLLVLKTNKMVYVNMSLMMMTITHCYMYLNMCKQMMISMSMKTYINQMYNNYMMTIFYSMTIFYMSYYILLNYK